MQSADWRERQKKTCVRVGHTFCGFAARRYSIKSRDKQVITATKDKKQKEHY
jgi:hypothetical protein